MSKKKNADAAATQPAERAGAADKGKITLPAFGLAEDLLGAKSAEQASVPEMSVRAADGEQPAAGEYHLVSFRIGGEEYGVEIGRVQEIVRVGQVTAVPNAPAYIKGVINLRGRIIPVLDLRKRLDLEAAAPTKNSRIIVVEMGQKVLGLLVDSVAQVVKIPASSVDAPPEDVEASRAYVKGIGKIDMRLIMVMELDRVLARDAQTATA